MYNPVTGEAFMASSYELHLAYSDLGYVHNNPVSIPLPKVVDNPIPFVADSKSEESTTQVAAMTAPIATTTTTYTAPSGGGGGGGGGGGY